MQNDLVSRFEVHTIAKDYGMNSKPLLWVLRDTITSITGAFRFTKMDLKYSMIENLKNMSIMMHALTAVSDVLLRSKCMLNNYLISKQDFATQVYKLNTH